MTTHLFSMTEYVALLEEAPLDRIGRVRRGVPARWLSELSASMGVPREKLLSWIGISNSTAELKLRGNSSLSLGDGERTLGMARVVGLVAKIVAESGDFEDFNAAEWTGRWLDRPNAALGGRFPGDLMDTADGRQIVASLILKMQSGAYS